MSTEHTPTPLEISEARTVDGKLMIVGGEGLDFGLIAECADEKHAAFIIKACNNHDLLVRALQDLIGHARWVGGEFDIHYGHIDKAISALSLSQQSTE